MLDHYNIEFSPNKAPVAALREGIFNKTFSKNIYPDVNGKR